MDCNKCERPFCNPPALQFKIRSASKSKCGAPALFDSGSYYTDAAWNGTCETGDHFVFSGASSAGKIYKAMGGVFGGGHIQGAGCGIGSIAVSGSLNTSCEQTSRACSGAITFPDGDPGRSCDDVEWGSPVEARIGGVGLLGAAGDELHLSDEYTTAELLAATNAALPSFPDGWTLVPQTAYKHLAADESSFTLSQTQIRIIHDPTGLCYLKVWLLFRFTPEGGGSPSDNIVEYEWLGTGSPCFRFPNKPYNFHVVPPLTEGLDDNQITGANSGTIEPPSNGSITVSVQRWTCNPLYVPPEDGSANGYPPPDPGP